MIKRDYLFCTNHYTFYYINFNRNSIFIVKYQILMTSKADCYEIIDEIYQGIFEGLWIISYVMIFYVKLETYLSFLLLSMQNRLHI